MDSSSTTTSASTFQLPDSNQTICYDTTGTVRACAGTGEDGEYINTPAPYNLSITDSGETVTETSSGLIWTRCEANRGWNGSNCSTLGTNATKANWTSAEAYCSNLTKLDRSWRLPSAREASLLMDYSLTNAPLLSSMYFPNTEVNVSFWTGTPRHVEGEFYAISVDGRMKPYSSSTLMNVRCVSGPKVPSPEFEDLGNGIVLEKRSNLLIKQCVQGQTEDDTCAGTATSMTWQEALDSCNNLNFGGRNDWRLPSIREIYYLVEPLLITSSQMLPEEFFPNPFGGGGSFWTATTFALSGSHNSAYYQGIASNDLIIKTTSSGMKVRCVSGN